jgi:HSP20 family protein
MTTMTRWAERPLVEWPEWFSHRFFGQGWPLFDEAEIKVEERLDDDTYVIRAELPGVDPDKDVEVTVEDGALHVRAERRESTKTEEKNGYRSEFRYGSFARTIPLPSGATEKDVVATYEDGILEVRVPLDAKKAATKRVAIARS